MLMLSFTASLFIDESHYKILHEKPSTNVFILPLLKFYVVGATFFFLTDLVESKICIKHNLFLHYEIVLSGKDVTCEEIVNYSLASSIFQ